MGIIKTLGHLYKRTQKLELMSHADKESSQQMNSARESEQGYLDKSLPEVPENIEEDQKKFLSNRHRIKSEYISANKNSLSQSKSMEPNSIDFLKPRVDKSAFRLAIQTHQEMIQRAFKNKEEEFVIKIHEDNEEWKSNESMNSSSIHENRNQINNDYSINKSQINENEEESFHEHQEYFEETFLDGAEYIYPNNPNFFIYWKINFEDLGISKFKFSRFKRSIRQRISKKDREDGEQRSKFAIELGLYYMNLLELLYKINSTFYDRNELKQMLNISQEMLINLQECKSDESFRTETEGNYSTLDSHLRDLIIQRESNNKLFIPTPSHTFHRLFHCYVDLDLKRSKVIKIRTNENRRYVSKKDNFCATVYQKYSNVEYVPKNRNLRNIVNFIGLNKPKIEIVQDDTINNSSIMTDQGNIQNTGIGKYLYKIFLNGSEGFKETLIRNVEINLIKKIQN
jgi:hypothetical protein